MAGGYQIAGEGTGERIQTKELSATPSTPAIGKWKEHFKPAGKFYLEDTGVETQCVDTPTGTLALDDLSDVVITAAAVGDYLRYNGTNWVDVTVSQLLTDLLTVDGAGSLLDADLLDGQSGAYYLDRANHTGDEDMDGGDIIDLDEIAFNDAVANPTLAGRLRRNGANLVYNGGLHAMDNLAAGDLAGARMIWDDTALTLALYSSTPLLALLIDAVTGAIEWGTISGDPASTRQLRNNSQAYGQDLRYHDGTAARSTINKVRKNSAGTVYSRPTVNMIEGAGITITLGEDVTDGDVDVTIAAAGGSEAAANSKLRHLAFTGSM